MKSPFKNEKIYKVLYNNNTMRCKRCGYIWKEKKAIPKQCPKCKQYYYNRMPLWKTERKPVEQEKSGQESKPIPIKKEREVSFT